MKKIWKFLGAAAALACVVPYRVERNSDTNETKCQALLWRAVSRPDETGETHRDVTVTFGFNGILKAAEERLFEDDESWCTPSAKEDSAPTCPCTAADAEEAACTDPAQGEDTSCCCADTPAADSADSDDKE